MSVRELEGELERNGRRRARAYSAGAGYEDIQANISSFPGAPQDRFNKLTRPRLRASRHTDTGAPYTLEGGISHHIGACKMESSRAAGNGWLFKYTAVVMRGFIAFERSRNPVPPSGTHNKKPPHGLFRIPFTKSFDYGNSSPSISNSPSSSSGNTLTLNTRSEEAFGYKMKLHFIIYRICHFTNEFIKLKYFVVVNRLVVHSTSYFKSCRIVVSSIPLML